MRRTLVTGAAVLALSFGAVACGSSDDSGDSEDALPKAELIAQADALCLEFDGEVQTAFEDATLTEMGADGRPRIVVHAHDIGADEVK